VLGVARSTMMYQRKGRDEDALRHDIIRHAKMYGQYGYRKIAQYRKDSPMIRKRSNAPNHVWAIDFVQDKLINNRPYKMLTLVDEYTLQALAVNVGTKLGSVELLETLYPLIIKHRKPEHIRSDNGPEFVSELIRCWLQRVGIEPIHIYSGSPCENGHNERFNGTLRNEMLNIN